MSDILPSIISSAISAAALIIVAVIETRNNRSRKQAEKRAERRAEESRLSMALMSSTCELGLETVKALRDGHTNGTLAGHVGRAEKALDDYNQFLKRETAEAVSEI